MRCYWCYYVPHTSIYTNHESGHHFSIRIQHIFFISWVFVVVQMWVVIRHDACQSQEQQPRNVNRWELGPLPRVKSLWCSSIHFLLSHTSYCNKPAWLLCIALYCVCIVMIIMIRLFFGGYFELIPNIIYRREPRHRYRDVSFSCWPCSALAGDI